MPEIVLYDYWRSSASYRVRIALNLLGLPYRAVSVDLSAGEHRSPDHLTRNPQGAVPVIEIDGRRVAQSLAVIEYLHETHPDSTLLPADPEGRVQVRRVAHAIAMDIHPVCNLSVVNRVVELARGGEAQRQAWMQEFIGRGLDAVEAILAEGQRGSFCFGGVPTLADVCLVPQLYNARRWECDTARWPRLLAIDKHCAELEAFRSAHPDVARAATGG